MTPLRRVMIEEMKIRNYSEATQKHYVCYVADFAKYSGKSPDYLGPDEIRAYQLYLIEERGPSVCIALFCDVAFRVQSCQSPASIPP